MESEINQSLQEVKSELQHFSWPDYLIFALMLLVCIVIGIYFALSSKSTSTLDYLIGGRSMKVFPVSLSLIASYISGITLLGTPTEIYLYGIQYIYSAGGILLMGVIMTKAYLPVFHDLKLTSSYEYLGMRFDKRIRIFGSLLFFISMTTWLPIVIYVPALAFNQASGVNIHITTLVVCIVCIFYTCVVHMFWRLKPPSSAKQGGLRAVIWTDVVQTFIMVGAMLLIIFKATNDIGGLSVIIERNIGSGRIEKPDWTVDFTRRHTVWSLVFGGCMSWLHSNAIRQYMVQRYLSLKTREQATKAVWAFVFGTIGIIGLCSFSGLVIFAKYYDCDPLTTQLIQAKDQLLPLLVMDTLGMYPGLPGVFVGGVFSAALSSLSTGLNSMAAVALEDFYKTFINGNPSNRESNILMKSVVVVTGIICVCLVPFVEKLGSVLQLIYSLESITSGTCLGIFTIGLFFPWVNAKSALIGGIVSMVFMLWMVIGSQAAISSGAIKFPQKTVTTEGCKYRFNSTYPTNVSLVGKFPHRTTMLFELSYMWYTLLGAAVAIFIAIIVSLSTLHSSVSCTNPKLLSPVIRRFLPKEKKATDVVTNCFEIPVINIVSTAD